MNTLLVCGVGVVLLLAVVLMVVKVKNPIAQRNIADVAAVIGWVALVLTAVWAFCFICYDPKVYGFCLIFHLPWKITLALSPLAFANERCLWNIVSDMQSLASEVAKKMDPEQIGRAHV